MMHEESLSATGSRWLEPISTARSARLAAGDPHEDHTVHCGITLISTSGLLETITASDDLPVQVDRLQQELQQGPCLEPTVCELVVVSDDLATDPRWPDFGRTCVAVTGLRSMLSVRFSQAGDQRAAVNLYSTAPSAFGRHDTTAAASLARLAANGVEVLGDKPDAVPEAAPDGRFLITTASRILARRYRVSSPEAIAMLREASQDLRCGLPDIASEVVLRGRLPAREISRARRDRRAAAQAAAGS